MPEDARRAAWTALPAMVAAGDFERAERYLPDPLARIGELNAMAASLPLFPPLGAALRLAGIESEEMRALAARKLADPERSSARSATTGERRRRAPAASTSCRIRIRPDRFPAALPNASRRPDRGA